MDLQSQLASDDGRRAPFRGLVALFVTVAILAITDLVADSDLADLPHLAVEASIVVAGGIGALLGGRELRRIRRAAQQANSDAVTLGQRLQQTSREADRWREQTKELLQGLGAAIDRQFDVWQLTAAERDVALLLLKGLSHKEVAAARSVGEATVRQQARGIYRKAGVEGRHDLAAFFLEDMLAPPLRPAGQHLPDAPGPDPDGAHPDGAR